MGIALVPFFKGTFFISSLPVSISYANPVSAESVSPGFAV